VLRFPDPSDQAVVSFLRELEGKDIRLDERYIRRLIKNELNRTNNDPPVYDLDYDIVLQEAVRYLGD
jgi:hypothetical protein